MKREVIAFRQMVGANTSGRIQERIKDGGYIEEIRVRFYAGVERSLQVRPYVLHDSRKIEEVLTYAGEEKHISGDDDYLVFPVAVRVEYDDEMIVEYNNTSTYQYSLIVDVVVTYDEEVRN